MNARAKSTLGRAPLVSGWQRQYPRDAATFTAPPVGGGGQPAGPTVEIYYGEAWHDISPYVFYESRITITRGRPDEANATNPAQCTLVLNNRLGYFSPRNPVSPLYGLIGRNTPLRVSKVVNGVRFFRFAGEVVAWPDTIDVTGQDVRTPITAAGIKQRIAQGDSPINSSMYREHTKPSRVGIVAYWAFEDAENSGQVASGLARNPAMTINGTPTFGNYSDWKASDALPLLGATSFTGQIAPYTSSSGVLAVDLILLYQSAVALTRVWSLSTTGSAARWDLLTDTSGNLQLKGFDSSGTTLVDSGGVAFNAANQGLQLERVQLTQNGANIDYVIHLFPLSNAFTGTVLAGTQFSGTLNSQTLGIAKSITVGPDKGLTTVVGGHLAIGADLASFANTGGALTAWNGEAPDHRYARVCGEEGFSFGPLVRADSTNDTTMGWQGLVTLADLFQGIVDTDLGYDVETRDQVGLTYRPRTTLYNQAAAVTLDYGSNQLALPLAPLDDDQLTRNDITVTRDGGSSARVELTDGALSTQAPPNGVGRYDDAKTLSLGSDDQCLNQAGWRVHLGTVDEPRQPAIEVQLSHPSITASYELTAHLLALEIGDRIDVENPPSPIPPDTIRVIVQGYTETLDQFLHEITFTGSPASPWDAGILGDAVYARADTDGSSLHQDYPDPATTSLLVDVTAGTLWTTNGAHFPFDVTVAGEVWTVTGITGSSSPQTWTVIRAVNGAAKPQKAGADVRLTHPTIIGL